MGKTFRRRKSEYDESYEHSNKNKQKFKETIRDQRRQKQERKDHIGEEESSNAGSYNREW